MMVHCQRAFDSCTALTPTATRLPCQHRAVLRTSAQHIPQHVAPRHLSALLPPKAAANRTHAAATGSNSFPAAPAAVGNADRRSASPPAEAAAAAAAADARYVAAVAASPPEYSADTAAVEWSARPVPVVARLLEIAAAFGSWWLRAALHRKPQQAAAEMRQVLVDLGPAFVKIGQALSSRPDVLPPEYIAELELLQDQIPPFPTEEALQVIEEELGLPWTEVFSSLSPCPVAAASLGQVYRGRLVSNRAEVAVKVQRPGVVEAIGRDTYILRNLAAIARKQLKLNTDLPGLVDEWAASLFKELDYRREAANAIRFGQLFSFMPEVVVPKMFTGWTTARVLVMEWIEGERLRSAGQQAGAAESAAAAEGAAAAPNALAVKALPVSSSSSSRSSKVLRQHHQPPQDKAQVAEDLRLVEIGVRCSLEQMLEEGFYHADPHPGNLLKTLDGRLAYIDFGMMGSIEPPVRQALIRATLHLVNREYERLAEDFVALGLLPPGSDMDEVIPALSGVFQTALAGGVSNISFSTLSADLGRTMYRYSFRIPRYYTLLVRSLSVLEGIALASDPNYKVLGAAYPWVSRRLLLTTDSPELTATLDNLLYDATGRFNFDRLESLLEQAAKARVAAATAATAAGSSSTQLAQQQQQQQPSQSNSLTSFAAAVGSALAGPEGSELLVSSLNLLNPGARGSSGGGWQQQQQRVAGRGSAAAAAGGPLALVLSPEGRHIRGILEDELAKGLDAAWRLALDNTLDVASERLEELVTLAAASPFGRPWADTLQRQLRSNGSSSGSNGSSGSSSDAQPDLIESLLNIPRLSGEDDRVQVEGLTRLAVALADLSAPKTPTTTSTTTSSTTTSSTIGSSSSTAVKPQQQQQQVLTARQAANAATLQQVRQAAVVLQWLLSEVQLLSPEAQREALTIPMHILSKLASRLTARAVRTVLVSPSGVATGSGTADASAAAGGPTVAVAAMSRNGSNGRQVVAAPAAAPPPPKAAAGRNAAPQQVAISSSNGRSNGRVVGGDGRSSSAGINRQPVLRPLGGAAVPVNGSNNKAVGAPAPVRR